jgi:hypothetical protein
MPTEEISLPRKTAIINTDRRDIIAKEDIQPSLTPTEQVASQLAIKHEQRQGDGHL